LAARALQEPPARRQCLAELRSPSGSKKRQLLGGDAEEKEAKIEPEGEEKLLEKEASGASFSKAKRAKKGEIRPTFPPHCSVESARACLWAACK